MVKNCGLARGFDFKREFEVWPRRQSRIVAPFGLTGAATMPINAAFKQRAEALRPIASLILVTKRTAGGG